MNEQSAETKTARTLTGRVAVAGGDAAHHRARDLADVVGHVGQNPITTFVTDRVDHRAAAPVFNRITTLKAWDLKPTAPIALSGSLNVSLR